MNNFGDFVRELRREKNITQAELADALSVTNKAVSKWETGEAMPETGLLLPLSEILGVSVDELLNGARTETDDDPKPQDEQGDKHDGINGHLFTRGKDDNETLLDKICGAVCATVMLGGLAVYLIMGAVAALWSPNWVIVPACALSCGVIGCIFGLCDGQKRRAKVADGKNPYADCVCGILVCSSIIAYLVCGAVGGLWHPHWLIVALSIVAAGIIGATGTVFSARKKKRDVTGDNE